jgi:hypothetical protein
MKVTKAQIVKLIKEEYYKYLEDDGEVPRDVLNFVEKLKSSGLEDYVEKINKSDELYGLISVILKTALDSEASPIGKDEIVGVLEDITKEYGEKDQGGYNE